MDYTARFHKRAFSFFMKKKLKYIAIPIIAIALAIAYLFTFPNVSRLKKENPKKTSFMEYRETRSKKKLRIRQHWVPFSRISPYLVKAVIIAEDDKFWSHEGFDYEAMQKAFEKNLKAKRFSAGGSTITQQLAKNLYLTPEKSLFRKGREAIIAFRLERALTKKRILELYLNVVEWGDGIYGAEAASRHYFGKPASDLTPMEAARLVSVLPNPRRFNAGGEQRYVSKRANAVYNIMVRRGIVLPAFDEVMEDTTTPEIANEPIPPVEPVSVEQAPVEQIPEIEPPVPVEPDGATQGAPAPAN